MIRSLIRITLAATLAILPGAAPAQEGATKEPTKEEERLSDARTVYQELTATEVPKQLMEQCRCVAVIPGVVKGALGFGGRHGKGVLTCRDAAGTWSPPIF